MGGREEWATALAPPGVEMEGLDALAERFPSVRDPRACRVAVEAVKPSSGEAAPPTPTPAASLTPEEIRERILKLEPKYRE